MAATRRPLLLLLALGLVVLVLWAGWQEFGSPPATGGADPAAGEPGSSPPAGTALAAGAGTRRQVPVPGGEALPGQDAPVAGLRLRVVDPDDRPLAGAEVACYVARDGDDHVPESRRERMAWAEGTWRTGAGGEVAIDRPAAEGWVVYGRHDDLWGALYVAAADAGTLQVLRLQPDLALRVQVVDALDRPVSGVPVTLTGAERIDRRGGSGWTEPTEGDGGIATFAHVLHRIGENWGPGGVAILDFPLPELVFAPVVFRQPPVEPLVLRLPATGSLRVRLVEAGGRPFTPLQDEVYARLHQVTAAGMREHWHHLPGGVLDLSHVGLGLSFRMVLDTEECTGAMAFDGPIRAGEHVELEMPVTARPRLAGRLLDEQGRPQEGYWFATHVHPAPGWHNQYFETAADGRFVIPLPEMPGNVAAERSVIFRRTLRSARRQAFVPLGRLDLHEGTNDLGDVVLRPLPLLARGRVVDDRGEPVPGTVLLVFAGTLEDYWAAPTLDGGDLVAGGDGRFEIRGHVVTDRLLLRGRLGDQYGEPMAFSPGAEGLVYVLPRTGTLEMPLSLSQGLRAEDLLFRLRDRVDGRVEGRAARYCCEGDRLSWGGLRPGRYDLEVRALGVPEALWSAGDLEIRGGETTRLPELVLGENLQRIELSITDRQGRPVPRASVLVDPDRPAGPLRAARTTATGRVVVHTARVPVPILVMAPGYRSQRLPGVAEDRTVVLDEGLLLELRVRVPDGLLEPGDQLVPELRAYDPAEPDPQPWRAGHRLYLGDRAAVYYPNLHPWLWRQELPVDAGGRVRLRLPGPGTYFLQWRVEAPDRGRTAFSSDPATVTVGEGPGATVLECTLRR